MPQGTNHILFLKFPGNTKINMVKIAITEIPLQGLPIQTGWAPSTPIICIFKSSLDAYVSWLKKRRIISLKSTIFEITFSSKFVFGMI